MHFHLNIIIRRLPSCAHMAGEDDSGMADEIRVGAFVSALVAAVSLKNPSYSSSPEMLSLVNPQLTLQTLNPKHPEPQWINPYRP